MNKRYNQMWVNSWFWHTNAQQEIDYAEEFEGKFYAYEFKWNPLLPGVLVYYYAEVRQEGAENRRDFIS